MHVGLPEWVEIELPLKYNGLKECVFDNGLLSFPLQRFQVYFLCDPKNGWLSFPVARET